MSVVTFPKIVRSAVVAAVLGASALTAAPAQAQPSFSFDFHIGRPHFPGFLCMSDPEVRRDLRRDGYRDIRFTDRRGRIVHVRAERGRREYRIAYDTCRGRIVDRDRID